MPSRGSTVEKSVESIPIPDKENANTHVARGTYIKKKKISSKRGINLFSSTIERQACSVTERRAS